MKSNLISGIASWKSTALLAIVALVAAVAFSGVLTTGQPVDAQTDLVDNTADIVPGGKVNITGQGNATMVQFAVTGGSSSGTFANGETSIVCRDRNGTTNATATCDTNGDAAGITVVFTVDGDSPDGFVTITRTQILPVTTDDPTVAIITVTTQPVPASLTIKATSTSVAATLPDGETLAADSANVTTVVATVNNDQVPAAGMVGQTLTFVTSLGLIDCDGIGTGDAPAQVCQADTVAGDPNAVPPVPDGRATVHLIGGGAPGTASVEARHATLPAASASVTFFGDAKNLEAAGEQGSVEQGGDVFIVITVTDEAGNPVKGAQPAAAAAPNTIVGPGVLLKAVTTDFGVNKINPLTSMVAIPSCTAHIAREADDTQDPPVTASLGSDGTNDDGQCVVQVAAAGDDPATPADEAAARGVNTLGFVLGAAGPAQLSASAEITVAGAAATVESDAPDYVDPLSDTTITITVYDDEGVLVGATNINVVQVAGDGLTEGLTATGADSKQTVDGKASFTYAAGLSGEAVFRIIAGTGPGAVRDVITLTVGSAPEEVPDAPPATWSQELVSGTHNPVWNGEDGADPSAGAAEGVTAIWQWNGSSWDGYFPAAADVPGGNTLDSLTNGAAYWVIVE